MIPPFFVRPYYGGTPADRSIIEAIQDMRNARGLEVSFTPFLLMDIPAGNSLPNPYDGTIGQPATPWRGRITCDHVHSGGEYSVADDKGRCDAFAGID